MGRKIATLAFITFLLPACTASAVLAAEMEVKISNFTFNPPQLTVRAGTSVTWTNEDDIPHTVVSPPSIRSKVLDSEEKFSFTFSTPGTYRYFCSLHPHMTGTIVVEAAAGSNPSN